LAGSSELKAEFERLRADVQIARELVPLANAVERRKMSFPPTPVNGCKQSSAKPRGESYIGKRSCVCARMDLAIVVRSRHGDPRAVDFVDSAFVRHSTPLIQVAMLDTTGATRGDVTNEVAVLQEIGRKARLKISAAPRHWKRGKKPGPTKAGELSPKSFMTSLRARCALQFTGKVKPIEKV